MASPSGQVDDAAPAGIAMLAEAACLLVLARLLLAVLPFSGILRMLRLPTHSMPPDDPRRKALRSQVRNAIFRVWRRFPLSNTCFHRALAAYWMLARRGMATQLYYGASSGKGRGLEGHVWLKDGDAWILGREGAEGLPTLARFSGTERI